MVMVLEQEMVNRIAEIGRSRMPTEACGLMLPTPINGVQIIELPNRSLTPHDSFEMDGKDMYLAIESLFAGDIPENINTLISGMTAWHTHPSGGVGPSRFDMREKPANIHSLVVTLFTDGRAPLASWY